MSRSGKTDEFEGTRVDLGEDLLENTGVLPVPGVRETIPSPALSEPEVPDAGAMAEPVLDTPEQIQDNLESARILTGEGLLEEAKRILRKIILADSGHVVARKMLEEIHELELKQIFGDGHQRRFARGKTPEQGYVDSEKVMRDLDRHLKLGVFGEDGAAESLAARVSLFEDDAAMAKFAEKLDRQLADASARDRLDLGIGFIEMGLHDLAVRQFRAATRDPVFLLPATGLAAYALVLAGRSFEAIMTLEPVLLDTEVAHEEKLEFLYLMGRANEGLKNGQEAIAWYQQARAIEPRYRDAEDRIRALTRVQQRG